MAELIVRYAEESELYELAETNGRVITDNPLVLKYSILRGGYAIVQVDDESIPEFVKSPGILFSEIPTRVYFAEEDVWEAEY